MKKSSLVLACSCLLLSSFSALACGYEGSPESSQDKLSKVIAGPSMSEELLNSELPLSCEPCEEDSLCIKNHVSGTFAAGQAGVQGWSGQFFRNDHGYYPPDNYPEHMRCANHLTTQAKTLTKAGLDPATTPIACIPTRHFMAACDSGLIPVMLKSNKPVLDPAEYRILISTRFDASFLEEYAPCVEYFRPLLSHKKVCLKALNLNQRDVVFVLAKLDAKDEKVTVLKEFRDIAQCEAATL